MVQKSYWAYRQLLFLQPSLKALLPGTPKCQYGQAHQYWAGPFYLLYGTLLCTPYYCHAA